MGFFPQIKCILPHLFSILFLSASFPLGNNFSLSNSHRITQLFKSRIPDKEIEYYDCHMYFTDINLLVCVLIFSIFFHQSTYMNRNYFVFRIKLLHHILLADRNKIGEEKKNFLISNTLLRG